MKRILAIVLVALVASAQAATVKWNWQSSAGVKFDTTSLGGNGTAYLLFIGSDSIDTYTFDEYVTMAQTENTPVATAATKMSKINATVTTPDTAGNFVSVLSYKNGDDLYWNVASEVYALTQANIDALVNDGTAIPNSSFVHSSTVNSTAGSGTVGGGWAMVPEPSTAALALAGLALLIKRRRA